MRGLQHRLRAVAQKDQRQVQIRRINLARQGKQELLDLLTHRVPPGVDDAAAILMALASREIEVLGLSIVAGNVPLSDTVTNACKLVALSGRRDVPVHAGASGPLVREQVYGKYARIGSFDDTLVKAGDLVPAEEGAVQFIVRSARAAVAAGEQIII